MKILMSCAIIIIGSCGLAYAGGYVGSETCFKCHPSQYNDFIVSGHSIFELSHIIKNSSCVFR